MARKIVAGNWKMNLLPDEGYQLIEDLSNFCEGNKLDNVEVVVSPPFIHLAKAAEMTAHSKVTISAQNCSDQLSGAYTGEVSVEMLKAAGVNWTLIGHSERREYYGDTDEFVNGKLKRAIEAEMTPVLCVGEVLEDRNAGKQEEVVASQLKGALAGFLAEDVKKMVIAYEPVWAIGTGETASPEQAQEVHAFIRKYLTETYSAEVANAVSILYGGSVKPENAKEIFGQPDVDGGLIGGASLKYEQFVKLIEIGQEVL
ncbi:triose-phosphate isomerase [Owenweeksia hongkongensis]|uniref:triose-phosphate isomerase n=1 Tax=Owenweeksia hongkongensis TaxID=253245 RepID=UPI003A8DF9BE